jgi:hypothetical protein
MVIRAASLALPVSLCVPRQSALYVACELMAQSAVARMWPNNYHVSGKKEKNDDKCDGRTVNDRSKPSTLPQLAHVRFKLEQTIPLHEWQLY